MFCDYTALARHDDVLGSQGGPLNIFIFDLPAALWQNCLALNARAD
jgi:hypothetical protein